jgi:hypothetical protein
MFLSLLLLFGNRGSGACDFYALHQGRTLSLMVSLASLYVHNSCAAAAGARRFALKSNANTQAKRLLFTKKIKKQVQLRWISCPWSPKYTITSISTTEM